MARISLMIFVVVALIVATSTAQYEAVTESQSPFPSPRPSMAETLPTNDTAVNYPRVVIYNVPNLSTFAVTGIATMTMIITLIGSRREYKKVQLLKESLSLSV
jgi:hypothetical protein